VALGVVEFVEGDVDDPPEHPAITIAERARIEKNQ
jgi:hypothetical protein